MFRLLNGLLRPHLYLGEGNAALFRESWYFHQQNIPDGVSARAPFSFSALIGYESEKRRRRAFVVFIDGRTNQVRRFDYPGEAFRHQEEPFSIEVGPNRFSLERMELHLSDAEGTVEAELAFGPMVFPRRTLFRPSTMAPGFILPLLQGRHEIISLYHECRGTLTIAPAAKTVPVVNLFGNNGYGYAEKDWGRLANRGWMRIQANMFEGIAFPSAFSFALARMTGNVRFPLVFSLIMMIQGREFQFAPFTGARIDLLEEREDSLRIMLSDRNHKVEINARKPRGGPERRVSDSGQAQSWLRVILKRRHGPTEDIVFDGMSRTAAVEVFGDSSPTAAKAD